MFIITTVALLFHFWSVTTLYERKAIVALIFFNVVPLHYFMKGREYTYDRKEGVDMPNETENKRMENNWHLTLIICQTQKKLNT